MRRCLSCRRQLLLDLYDRSGTGRRWICQDCTYTPELRALCHRVAAREHARRKRYPWYAAAA